MNKAIDLLNAMRKKDQDTMESFLLLVMEMEGGMNDKYRERFEAIEPESIERKRIIIQWAHEFDAIPKAENWCDDYYDIVDNFVITKINERI